MIIADDYTGALDTGVQFSRSGNPTLVTAERDLEKLQIDDNTEVVAVDTESRHDDPGTAYRKVWKLAAQAYRMGISSVYKKTDSALRGNVGPELEAVLRASGEKEMIFVPAYPKSGRTTVGGVQYINGDKVDKTAFGRDPFNPLRHSYIPDIIAENSRVPVKLQQESSLSQETPYIRIFDASTEEEMKEVAREVIIGRKWRAMAGCAGFAEYLVDILQLGKSKKAGKEKKIFLISGSIHEVTVRQIQKARDRGFPVLNLSNEAKFQKSYLNTKPGEKFIKELIGKFQENRLVVLEATAGREAMEESRKYTADQGITDEDARMLVAGRLGEIARIVIENIKIDILAVFGGDTLMGIIKSLHAAGVRPLHEIEPGTVISDLIGGECPIQIVSKSGGLGTEDIVRNIVYYFND